MLAAVYIISEIEDRASVDALRCVGYISKLWTDSMNVYGETQSGRRLFTRIKQTLFSLTDEELCVTMTSLNENDTWINKNRKYIIHLTRQETQIPNGCYFLAYPVRLCDGYCTAFTRHLMPPVDDSRTWRVRCSRCWKRHNSESWLVKQARRCRFIPSEMLLVLVVISVSRFETTNEKPVRYFTSRLRHWGWYSSKDCTKIPSHHTQCT